jgi:glycosyltransferase involved in cell wall biosynthesis
LRLKIIWVTTNVPDRKRPGASAAEFEQLAASVHLHDIHLISTALPPGEIELQVGDDVIHAEGTNAFLYQPASPRTVVCRAVSLLRDGGPFRQGHLRAVRDVLNRRLAGSPADLVLLNGAQLAPLAGTGSVPNALLLSSLVSASFDWRTGRGTFRRLFWRLGQLRWRRWERRWYARATSLACRTEQDKAVLARLIARPAAIVPAGSPKALLEWWSLIVDHERIGRCKESSEPPVHRPTRGISNGEISATVVICTRNRAAMLRQTLPAVAEAIRRAPGTRLVIVEQGAPAAEAVCAELGIEADIVHDGGVGAARARNVGASAANSSVVLFTDDDCQVPPNWVVDHLTALRTNDVVASFGVVKGLSRWTEGPDAVSRRAVHRAGSPPWVIGHSANMAVDSDAFSRLRGFDERLGPGAPGGFVCEDADLIVRLLEADGAAVSGVGDPVDHIEWRSRAENLRNIRAYERGSGAWIGKFARTDFRGALPYARARVWLLRDGIRRSPGIRTAPVAVLLSLGDFFRGLIHGWLLNNRGAERHRDAK